VTNEPKNSVVQFVELEAETEEEEIELCVESQYEPARRYKDQTEAAGRLYGKANQAGETR
jgi:hypothetical protein